MPAECEMAVPTGRSNRTLVVVIWVLVVIFTLIAIVDLILGIATVASIIWLSIVAIGVIGNLAEHRGL